MFLSSIFSSRTTSFSDARGGSSLKTLALVLCLVGGAEAAARAALRPIGDYWAYWTPAAAAKFESYRSNVRRGTPPRVLVVGDSTGARDIDPRPLAEATGRTAFNLAWPANFPLAFKSCTLPLLETGTRPDLVVASFIPSGFLDSNSARRFEQAILESSYCRRQREQISASDYSYLARIRPSLPFLRSWWTGRSLPTVKNLGFMPLTGSDDAPEVPTRMAGFEDQRFAAIEDLYRAGHQFTFQVVVLIPPRRDPTAELRRAETEYLARLERCGFEYVDYREPSFLTASDFHDRNHLNAHGAQALSQALGAELARRVAAGGQVAQRSSRCIRAASSAE